MKREKKFKLRPFVTFFLTLSFIELVITGIILYIVPPGRIANWTNWKLLGLDKGTWEGLHTTGGLFFAIFSIIHIALNWKVLLNYIRAKTQKTLNRWKELVAAILFFLFVSIGTAVNWVPFSTIMDFGETISNSWETSTTNSGTKGNNNSERTVTSEENINQQETGEHGNGVGQGMGVKTFREVVESYNIDIDTAIETLREKGILINPKDKMRDIRLKYDIGFEEIIDIITKQ